MNTQRPIPLRPDPTARDREWKRSFIRAATCTALAELQKSNMGSAEQVLRANWPADDRAQLIVRGAVTPMQQGDYPGSSVVKLLQLASRSTAAQLFPLATTVSLVGTSSFQYPLATNFAAAAFVAENAPIPLRQGSFVGMPVGPVRKLALLAGLSSQLENASGGIAEAIISNTLEIAVGRGLDAVLLSSNAATADAPAGLLHNVTPVTGSADMTKDLSALVASIASAGIDTASVVFICSPPQALALSLTAGPHFTHKVIEAASLAAGTIIAIAVAGLVIAGDGGVPQIDISKQATLHFADPASPISVAGSPPVVAAPVLSTFQTDTMALRCISMVTWSAAPGSVAVVNGATW